MATERYLDVGPAIFGDWRVSLIQPGIEACPELFQHANDIAATARLLNLPVATTDPVIRVACRLRGVTLLNEEPA